MSGVQFLRAPLFNFRKERIGQDKEVTTSPRDGGELRSGKEKHEAEAWTQLARVRETAIEGSFGTQKEDYDLGRVKAMTKRTEILYIFFGIHTANVVQLVGRIEQRALLAAA